MPAYSLKQDVIVLTITATVVTLKLWRPMEIIYSAKEILAEVNPDFIGTEMQVSSFKNDLNNAYEEIFHRKRIMFLLPRGAAGKK